MTALMIWFFAAAATCYVLGFWIYRYLFKFRIMDQPNERSSHSTPTVRGGGISIMATIALGAVGLGLSMPSNLLNVVMPFVLLLAVLSFVDDLKSVSPLLRLGCHMVAGLAALFGLGWPEVSLQLGQSLQIGMPQGIVTLACFIWMIGYTNAFNFMDGINGIASMQALVTGLGAALLVGISTENWNDLPVLFSVVVAGAAAGFLPHNFPRARMFMGDVSSAPLGFLLATLVLWLPSRYGWDLLFPLVLLHANFMLDTGITLVRRVFKGEKWYAPHREHFYQRAVRAGKSHAFVTGWEFGLQLLTIALMVFYVKGEEIIRVGLAAVVVIIWLVFFAFCEMRFRSSQRRAPLADGKLVEAMVGK